MEFGPVPRTRLDELAAEGFIGEHTPVRPDSAGAWQPYADLVAAPPVPGRAPEPEGEACSRCGGFFPPEGLMTYRGARYCAACKRDYFQHLAQGTLDVALTPPFGFTKRALAKAVDFNIMLFLCASIAIALDDLGPTITPRWNGDWNFVVSTTLLCLFYLVASTVATTRFGGTPGKLLFHLRVTDRRGARLTYFHALTRALAEFTSIATLGLGYLITGSNGERHTLHDRIAFTRVVQDEGPWPWVR